ncbi:DUF551 domain-containing protein [Novosphingobium mathurense]
MDWRPIETYPYGTKWALAYHCICAHEDHGWIRFGKYYGELKRWYYSGTNETSQWAQKEGDAPTHWMPLPTLPGREDVATPSDKG